MSLPLQLTASAGSNGTSGVRKVPVAIQYLLMYLVISLSGGLLFQVYSKQALVVAFLVFLVIAVLYLRQVNAYFVIYATCFTALLLGVHFYTDGSLPLTSVLGTVLQLIMAYFVLQLVGRDFAKLFVNIVTFLAVVSLVGFIVDQIRALDPIVQLLPQYMEEAYEGFLYPFHYVVHLDRNISIFYEPAVYQGFLNAALFIIFFAPQVVQRTRQRWYVAILIVALATTFSTTGYLIFLMILALLLARGRVANRPQLIGAVAFVVAFAVAFSAEIQETLFEKLELYLSGSSLEEGVELRRKFDVLADIEIFKNNVWGAGFEKYQQEFALRSHGFIRPGELGGSSNGVTKVFAVYGVIFGLFLYGTFFLFFLGYFPDRTVALVGFVMVVMFFSAETLALRPLALCMAAGLTMRGSFRISVRDARAMPPKVT